MQRHHALFVGLLLLGATSAWSSPGPKAPTSGTNASHNAILPSPHTPVLHDLSRLPLAFEPNQGQTNSQVRFLTHTADSALFLTPSEAVFTLPSSSSAQSKTRSVSPPKRAKRPLPDRDKCTALRMQMVGANPHASALTQQPLSGRINYFIGKDPSKWHVGVPTYGRVGFHGVYPGVDLIYYGNNRHLEYDFVVAPHADPKQIDLHFAGAQRVWVNTAGDLVVRTQGRELKWQKPSVYQQDAAGKHAVEARFRLKRLPNGQSGVRFALGHYDADRPLIIDPVLLYSTYLGGKPAADGEDNATGIAIDSSGNAYVTGLAYSLDFPTTVGAFQHVKNGQTTAKAAFVTKFNATGTALVYSTFLGGSHHVSGDFASSIAVDSAGNAYVAGYTDSTDFPTTPSAFQTGLNGTSDNGFVTKLNPTGKALVYSTYLGGNKDGGVDSIAIDNGDDAYVTGYTKSTGFPTTPGAFQTTKNGGGANYKSAFVTKLNFTGTDLLYSTYLGGSNYGDEGYGIAVDNNGSAYVTGLTEAADFPTTPGAFQTGAKGGVSNPNAFVTKLNAAGSALLYSTYLGGSSGNSAYGIALDGSGNAYVTGGTGSTDFPTTPGAFQTVNRGYNAFVSKLNAVGSALLYSTFLGGSNTGYGDEGYGIAVDSNGNAYVTGYAHSTDFPTTVGVFQRVARSASVFVTKFNSTGSALLYSTYLGGSGSNVIGDEGDGIAVDSSGNAYVTGYAVSTDFPVTPSAFQLTNHANAGGSNSFVTKLSPVSVFPDFNNDGNTDLLLQNPTTGAIASWYMQGSQQIGSAPFSLTPPTEYALVGVGDFSGTGSTTLVLQSSITNQIAFWFTSGANNATIPGGHFVNVTPDANYKVVGVGDFNGDGKSDLVFQNQTTGQVAIWFMNGYINTGGVLLPFAPLAGWKVVGIGDFNADGFPDIAFQNQTTGQIALWYLQGTTYLGGAVMTAVPAAGWKVVGVGDYNGDGSADLLFQNQTTNQAAVWYLNDGAFAGGALLSLAPPTGWKIVGPR